MESFDSSHLHWKSCHKTPTNSKQLSKWLLFKRQILNYSSVLKCIFAWITCHVASKELFSMPTHCNTGKKSKLLTSGEDVSTDVNRLQWKTQDGKCLPKRPYIWRNDLRYNYLTMHYHSFFGCFHDLNSIFRKDLQKKKVIWFVCSVFVFSYKASTFSSWAAQQAT